jgi:hypothetical protein
MLIGALSGPLEWAAYIAGFAVFWACFLADVYDDFPKPYPALVMFVIWPLALPLFLALIAAQAIIDHLTRKAP